MAAASEERVLIYPGSAFDIYPIVLSATPPSSDDPTRVFRTPRNVVPGCGPDDPITDVLRNVDRFVFFDTNPYIPTTGKLIRSYGSLDHFVKFTEVLFSKLFGILKDPVHHETDQCIEFSLDHPRKALEIYYDADFYSVDPESRLYQHMQNAHVLYQQGFLPEKPNGAPDLVFFSAFPNVDTAVVQDNLISFSDYPFEEVADIQKLMAGHSAHDKPINVLLKPDHARSIYYLTE